MNKKCAYCGEEFEPSGNYQKYCKKKCYKKKERIVYADYYKKYREEKKEDMKEYSKKYYQDNKDKIYLNQKLYKQRNKPIIVQKSKKYREKNTEKMKAYSKIWHKKRYKERKEMLLERAKRRRINRQIAMLFIKKSCIVCGTVFHPKRDNNNFCSRKCLSMHLEENRVYINNKRYNINTIDKNIRPIIELMIIARKLKKQLGLNTPKGDKLISKDK